LSAAQVCSCMVSPAGSGSCQNVRSATSSPPFPSLERSRAAMLSWESSSSSYKTSCTVPARAFSRLSPSLRRKGTARTRRSRPQQIAAGGSRRRLSARNAAHAKHKRCCLPAASNSGRLDLWSIFRPNKARAQENRKDARTRLSASTHHANVDQGKNHPVDLL
jgi:hypothetical protein